MRGARRRRQLIFRECGPERLKIERLKALRGVIVALEAPDRTSEDVARAVAVLEEWTYGQEKGS